MIEALSKSYGWRRLSLLHEKYFWESELLEPGFCKLMMQGMYLRHLNNESNFDSVIPRLLVSGRAGAAYSRQRLDYLRDFLITNVGVDMGGW